MLLKYIIQMVRFNVLKNTKLTTGVTMQCLLVLRMACGNAHDIHDIVNITINQRVFNKINVPS